MLEIYINGVFFPEEEAKISVFDRGFLYGDGLFETLRVYNGKIFRLGDHLERLSEAAKRIFIPFDLKEGGKALYETLHRNRLTDALLRITLTRGQGNWGIDFPSDVNPTIVVFARPFTGYPGQDEGISIISPIHERLLMNPLILPSNR